MVMAVGGGGGGGGGGERGESKGFLCTIAKESIHSIFTHDNSFLFISR